MEKKIIKTTETQTITTLEEEDVRKMILSHLGIDPKSDYDIDYNAPDRGYLESITIILRETKIEDKGKQHVRKKS